MSRKQPPAYWLTGPEAAKVRGFVQRGDAAELGEFLRQEPEEVPSETEQNAALFGELIPLLEAVGGVFLPPNLKPDIPQSRDQRVQMYWQAGICILLDRAEAASARQAINLFMESATDEMLSDTDLNYLILFSGEPGVVRQGISFLQAALNVPEQFDSVLLVLR